ncbi:hypothetical protein CEG88_25430 [Klebsiella aerogenes]|nr:hypothetical protein CEG88_25430 [Klebsiella aerogenes]
MTGPFVYVDMAAAFPGGGAAHLFRATGCVAPVSVATPGEMAACLAAKDKSRKPGLPTEPFVYVAMAAAFPGGGAAHLFRATGCVAPVSAAPPGEMAVCLGVKHKKSPVFRLSLSFTLIWQRLFPEAARCAFSGLRVA